MVINTASVVSEEVTDPVEALVTTPIANARAMTLVKSEPVNRDEDKTENVTIKDTLTYTVTATNTGLGVETGVTVFDMMLTPPSKTCGQVLPGETCILTGTYAVEQSDIDAGEIVNTASVVSAGLTDPIRDTVTTPTFSMPQLEVKKVVLAQTKLFPVISDITFRITMKNIGDVTLTGVQLEDDIATAMAPAVIVGTPSVVASGFALDNAVNAAYDGTSAINTLSGNGSLPVGTMGTVDITVRLDFLPGYPGSPNTAYGNAGEIANPIPSDFPLATANDPNDQNPTPVPIVDLDGDGAPDDLESSQTDRDGDGVPDNEDYDPTGYFYCEEDGTILTDGLISVMNVATGGTQSGVGSSNDINIIQDGSSGFYQFNVTAAGRYVLMPSYPTSKGAISTSRVVAADIVDVTGLGPLDPAVVGAGEIGDTGMLSNFEAGKNPFYLVFDIEAGDPNVFNNNLPMMHCGTPVVAASKTLASRPDVQPDGSIRLTYRVGAENVGPTLIRNVIMVDDLATAFNAAIVSVVSTDIDNAPAGFTAGANPLFNGQGTNDLLTSGGDLAPGEVVTVDLVIDVQSVTGGTYVNTV